MKTRFLKQLIVPFFCSLALSAQVFAGPTLPPSTNPDASTVYEPKLTCNSGDPAIFQVLPRGDLFMVTVGKSEAGSLKFDITPVTETDANGGYSFTARGPGILTIDSSGKGVWAHEKMIQYTDDQGMHLVNQKIQTPVTCHWVAPTPSGFSAGN